LTLWLNWDSTDVEYETRIDQKNFLIVCFIENNSPLGKQYHQKKEESRFYLTASFYSVREAFGSLSTTGLDSILMQLELSY